MRIHYLFLISFIVFSCPCWADTPKEDIVSSTIFDAVQRDNEKLKIRLQALEAEKAREKAESVELRLAREVDRSLWEHEKCQILLQQIQIYFEKEKKNIQDQQKSEKDEREKYIQRVYNISNTILVTISVIGGLLAVIIGIGAWVSFGYFKGVKNEIDNIRNNIKKYHKEAINDVNDIRRQKENLYAHPKNDGTLDEKTVRQAQETSKNPNTENIIRSQAILYTNKKQWNEAYIFWKAVLEKEPNAPDVYFYVALSAHMLADKMKSNNEKQKWFDVAEENYRQSVQISPGSISSWCNWGNLCMARGEAASSPERESWFEQAAEKYRQATEKNPKHPGIWYNWACLESLRGNVALCVDYLEKWYALSPDASVAKLDEEKDFDPVRNSPEFIAFREKVQKGCGR